MVQQSFSSNYVVVTVVFSNMRVNDSFTHALNISRAGFKIGFGSSQPDREQNLVPTQSEPYFHPCVAEKIQTWCISVD
jgi:hypothetical protein